MNILVTVFDLHFGGINNLLVNTLSAYPSKFNIYVVYFGGNEEMRIKFEGREINLLRIPYSGFIDLYRVSNKLDEVIHNLQINIIHSHMVTDTYIVAFWNVMHPKNKIKKVSTLHFAANPFCRNGFLNKTKYLLLAVCRRFFYDHHIAVSRAAKTLWIRVMKLKPESISVVYNSIPKPDVKHGNKKVNDYFLFITACRLEPVKGLKRLICVLAKLKDYNWEFHIYGEGPEKDSLLNLTQQLGLGDKIHFKGFTRNAIEHISKADYYINSSFSEAFSVALLEASAVGTPIIASSVGGNSEIVIDNKNGYIVDFTNEVEVVSMFERALSADDEKMKQMQKAALTIFNSNFSIIKHVNGVIGIYTRITKKNLSV